MLCAGYIVEFIHDATENYYERGSYACRNCNNIKFPLYMLKVLSYACFAFLCQLIIVPISCLITKSLCIGSGLDLNVLIIFFMMLPLYFNPYLLCEHHHAQLGALNDSACWEATQFYFLCSCFCLGINIASSFYLDVVLCFNQCLCQVEPLGRLV